MNATRIPAGGPDDLEALLRSELGAVADAVGSDGRPAPASAVLARGRTARRRRRAALTGAAALATAAVVALGVGVAGPALRADSEPAGPTPAPTDAAGVAAWVRSLPVGEVPTVERLPRSQQGVVRWGGVETTLPAAPTQGLGRFAVPFGRTDRGLLLGWAYEQASPGDPVHLLGWLDQGRFSGVDTLPVKGAVVSPDGTRYAYSGPRVLDSRPESVNEVVVRTVADDQVVSRSTLPDGLYVRGWLGADVLLTATDGSDPRLLKGSGKGVALEPATDLVPLVPDGPIRNVPITSVRGGAVEFALPAFEGCPEVGGAATVQLGVRLVDGSQPGSGVTMGCFVPDAEPVSPDGRYYVGSGDEFTIRDTVDGNSVHGPAPGGVTGRPREMPIGAATVFWESDGRHVQVVLLLAGSTEPTVVRCSAPDGICVRDR